MSWLKMYPREAKFSSDCPRCEKGITAGERIAWKPGRAAEHWSCHLDSLPKREPRDTSRGWERRWTLGSGRRTLSERAKRDHEAVKRAQETHRQAKAAAAQQVVGGESVGRS